jgi:glycosyltransferase involved in cell wall biosynthesis
MPKRLLIVAPSFYPASGGVEMHLQGVLPHLRQQGYEPTVLVRYAPQIPAKQVVKGTTVLRLPRHDNRLILGLWMAKHRALLQASDAIHSHDYFPLSLFKRYGHKPWIHTFHGYEGYPLAPAAITARRHIRSIVSACIGVGAFIEKWYGTVCDQWIYGAIETATLPAKQAPKWDVIFYGRLEADTGIASYLEGFKLISAKHPSARLLVVGNGSLLSWAQQYAKDNNLAIDFKPATLRVLQYVAQARIAFVSGYLAILESAAIGLPIISIYDTPIKQDYLLMHPMAKHFSIANSPTQVAQAYQTVSASNRADKQLQAWARSQTWDKIAKIYTSYYEPAP